MEFGCTNLTQTLRTAQMLKINGWSVLTMFMTSSDCFTSSWNVHGYKWEVQLFPKYASLSDWVALKFIFLGEVGPSAVRAKVTCRLADPAGIIEPSEVVGTMVKDFMRNDDSFRVLLMKSSDVKSSRYLIDDSLTVQCSITVLEKLKHVTIPSQEEEHLPTPPSDMHQHFGELLQRQTGADVTFTVAGESFAAHKSILAARSPVFMAEFFGNMEERSSHCVQIDDMDAAVFKHMLHFIYTDTVPEFDEKLDDQKVNIAQHLLAAADRYGLDRLKVICEGKLCRHIDADTATTTLTLAEQHNCSQLKAKCIDFITSSSEKLNAVLVTEGYKHLVASCPSVLTELLKAARERRD